MDFAIDTGIQNQAPIAHLNFLLRAHASMTSKMTSHIPTPLICLFIDPPTLPLFSCISLFIAGSLESANSSILLACNLFKDFGGEKIRILC